MLLKNKSEIVYKKETEISGIKIEKINIYQLEIPLNIEFSISLGSQNFYEGIIIEMKTSKNTGYGEAETIQQITGETPNVLFNIAEDLIRSMEGKKFDSIEDASLFINSFCYGNSAAKSSVEMAIYELLAKEYNISLYRFLGGSLNPRLTSLTIPIGSVKQSLELLENYQKSGTKIIKIKIGKNLDDDMEKINKISENIESGVKFFADANQGYNLNQALKMSNLLYRKEALFIEQPLPRNFIYETSELRKKTELPVMLDESISTPYDIINAIRYNAADLINVKLSKSGGIRNAIKILNVAAAAGIDAMVGCMLESKLGIAASLAIANSTSNVKYTDLDGYTYLSEQPFEGLDFKDGMNYPNNKSGLGVTKNNWNL